MVRILSRIIREKGDIRTVAYGIKIGQAILGWSAVIPLKVLEGYVKSLAEEIREEDKYDLIKDFVLNYD